MTEQSQASFNGYARVEVMGHQVHIGYVRTEAYGQAVLFRIDTPELPEREWTLEAPEWIGSQLAPVGTKVQRPAVPGGSVLIGAGSIYRIVPCSEAAALKAIENGTHRPLKVIDLPPGHVLAPPESRDYTCCNGNPDDGHDDDCENSPEVEF
jgi:hypothetical protein